MALHSPHRVGAQRFGYEQRDCRSSRTNGKVDTESTSLNSAGRDAVRRLRTPCAALLFVPGMLVINGGENYSVRVT
jgi:hypothetical protein